MGHKTLFIFFQKIIPQHLISRVAGWMANCDWTWFKNFFIQWFIRHYQVNLTEAVVSEATHYPTFNSFFTRYLKPESRVIDPDPNCIVSPVDGILCQAGSINQNSILQAKGIDYTVDNLLGSKDLGNIFQNGSFITLYLAPKDYHRIHMPLKGRLVKIWHIPGSLFSVNCTSVENIKDLFARNERAVCLFETDLGPMAIVLVGAMIVASIHTVVTGKIQTNRKGQIQEWDFQKHPITLDRGQELGHFELGSTVILLFSSNKVKNPENFKPNDPVHFGQCLSYSETPF